MADTIVIAPELPFRQQVVELAVQASRSLTPPDQAAAKEFVSSFESQVSAEELSEDQKKEVVKSLVGKFAELRGGLDGPKEADAESSHLLLQHVLATTFDPSSDEYANLVKSVSDAVKKGAESSNKSGRIEAAARILNNTYNSLPTSSPLRASTLLTLVQLLGNASDLSSLPLSSTTLASALSQWSISTAEKTSFLSSASDIYLPSDPSKSLELLVLALQQAGSPDSAVVEKAIQIALAIPTKFELNDVLRVAGGKDKLSGKAKEVVGLFEGDEIEAVGKGSKWVADNSSWIESAGLAGLTADSVLRKLRLIALVALAARSESRQLGYGPIAQALSIDESEVEAWVIDAIRSKLLVARISQPLSLVRIQSISLPSSASRFGQAEWQLLEKRLQEWKAAVTDARAVIDDAEVQAQQGLGVQQRRPGAGPRQYRERGERGDRGERGEREQREQGQEVAA